MHHGIVRHLQQEDRSDLDALRKRLHRPHANAAMTLNIYASADPEAKRRAAQIMDGAI